MIKKFLLFSVFTSALTLADDRPLSDPQKPLNIDLSSLDELQKDLCNSAREDPATKDIESVTKKHEPFPHTGISDAYVNDIAGADFKKLLPLPCAGDDRLKKIKITLVSEAHNCANCFALDLRRSVVDGKTSILYLREGPSPEMGSENPEVFFLSSLENPQYVAFRTLQENPSPTPLVIDFAWQSIKDEMKSALSALEYSKNMAQAFLHALEEESKTDPEMKIFIESFKRDLSSATSKKKENPWTNFSEALDKWALKFPEKRLELPFHFNRILFKHSPLIGLVKNQSFIADWTKKSFDEKNLSNLDYYNRFNALVTIHYRSIEMALAFGKKICESLKYPTPLPVYIRIGLAHASGLKAAMEKTLGANATIEIKPQAADYCKLSPEDRETEVKDNLKKVKGSLTH